MVQQYPVKQLQQLFRVCCGGLHCHVAGSHYRTDIQAAEGAPERLLFSQEQGDGNGCL